MGITTSKGILLGLLIILLIPNPVFAQTAISNPVITAVGNPPADQKPKLGGNLTKAAQDLVSAYTACGSYANSATVTGSCFRNALLAEGYVSDVVGKMANYHRYDSGDCVECTGFVIQAIVLAYGDADPLFGGDHVGIDGKTPFDWPQMNNNNHILKNIGTSNPQPGDIAVNKGDSAEAIAPNHGHISIVTSVNKDRFTAAESNWSDSGRFASCHISNSFEHPWVRHTYTFFREQ